MTRHSVHHGLKGPSWNRIIMYYSIQKIIFYIRVQTSLHWKHLFSDSKVLKIRLISRFYSRVQIAVPGYANHLLWVCWLRNEVGPSQLLWRSRYNQRRHLIFKTLFLSRHLRKGFHRKRPIDMLQPTVFCGCHLFNLVAKYLFVLETWKVIFEVEIGEVKCGELELAILMVSNLDQRARQFVYRPYLISLCLTLFLFLLLIHVPLLRNECWFLRLLEIVLCRNAAVVIMSELQLIWFRIELQHRIQLVYLIWAACWGFLNRGMVRPSQRLSRSHRLYYQMGCFFQPFFVYRGRVFWFHGLHLLRFSRDGVFSRKDARWTTIRCNLVLRLWNRVKWGFRRMNLHSWRLDKLFHRGVPIILWRNRLRCAIGLVNVYSLL